VFHGDGIPTLAGVQQFSGIQNFGAAPLFFFTPSFGDIGHGGMVPPH
jgi:hypothetical protein